MGNEIQIAGVNYTDSEIVSGNVLLVQSLDGDELQYNTLDATLDLGAIIPTLFRPKGQDGMLTSEDELFGVRPLVYALTKDPSVYHYGSIVLVMHDGVRIGKFYMSSMTRVSKTHYRISCMSAIGMLGNSQHYGGIYNGISLPNLVADVIGNVVNYSVAPEFKLTPVYGWLPVATRRENLHQILFAMGASVMQDSEGDIYIAPLSDDTHTEIPDNRLYLNGSVEYPEIATSVSVSEHTFVKNDTDEQVTLFEGLVSADSITTPSGVSATGSVVLFQEPMHDLTVTNGEIIESGVNYAVLAPSSSCTLVGKKYTHTIRQVTRPENSARLVSSNDNQITVPNATLVSIANSENVADRIMSYYSSAKKVCADIVLKQEQAGDPVQFTDPFGDLTDGIIHSLDITLSHVLKAKATIISDYSPANPGNFYTDLSLITSNSSWVVPDGITKIRVVLIGGGAGGYSGAKGQDGTNDWDTWGNGGDGGAKGQGGLGGNILIFTLTVVPGESFSVTVGSGGVGGICTSTDNASGTNGTESTFGNRSSAEGVPSGTGYTDLFSGTTYGLPGLPGVADGGAGIGQNNYLDPESITVDGVTYFPGANGSSDSGSGRNPDGERWSGEAYGGGGGGAAYGSNGGNGGNGRVSNNNNWGFVNGGDGGKGGNAAFDGKNASVYGCGGQGGSGGGGGGAGACGYENNTNGRWPGSGGAGGNGSNGGNGAGGCVLIYY